MAVGVGVGVKDSEEVYIMYILHLGHRNRKKCF